MGFIDASWQKNRTHFWGNPLRKAPQKAQPAIGSIEDFFAQTDKKEVIRSMSMRNIIE